VQLKVPVKMPSAASAEQQSPENEKYARQGYLAE
jgi:hypothetical protein